MSLLQTDTLIRLTTVERVKQIVGGESDQQHIHLNLNNLITTVSREAMTLLMRRGVSLESRTERLDIERTGQKIFHVSSWPIDTSTAPVVTYNYDTPRDFTGDAIDSDYIICNPNQAAQGIVYVDYSLSECVDALQIEYTGGLAEQTCLSGSDGTTGASGAFGSASADFVADEVAVGDTVVIYNPASGYEGDKDHFTVTARTNKNTLAVEPDFLNEDGADLIWEVYTSKCLCGAYPEIAMAADQQVAYLWRRSSNLGISRQAVMGMNITFYSGRKWVEDSLNTLLGFRRNW